KKHDEIQHHDASPDAPGFTDSVGRTRWSGGPHPGLPSRDPDQQRRKRRDYEKSRDGQRQWRPEQQHRRDEQRDHDADEPAMPSRNARWRGHGQGATSPVRFQLRPSMTEVPESGAPESEEAPGVP